MFWLRSRGNLDFYVPLIPHWSPKEKRCMVCVTLKSEINQTKTNHLLSKRSVCLHGCVFLNATKRSSKLFLDSSMSNTFWVSVTKFNVSPRFEWQNVISRQSARAAWDTHLFRPPFVSNSSESSSFGKFWLTEGSVLIVHLRERERERVPTTRAPPDHCQTLRPVGRAFALRETRSLSTNCSRAWTAAGECRMATDRGLAYHVHQKRGGCFVLTRLGQASWFCG